MSPLDHFESIDEMMKRIKEAYESDIKAMKDALLAAQIEATMCRNRLREATLDRDAHMRVSTKLISQFAIVEKVFAEAKALALAHFGEEHSEITSETQDQTTSSETAETPDVVSGIVKPIISEEPK